MTANSRSLIPTWRRDVTQAADIVEEVARIIGYDTLPGTLPPANRTRCSAIRCSCSSSERAARLAGAGFWETVTYVTVAPESPGSFNRGRSDARRSSTRAAIELVRLAQSAASRSRRHASDTAAQPARDAAVRQPEA